MGPFKRAKAEEVMGWRIAPPRLTFGAVWLAFKHIALPIIIGLGALDLIFYLFFQHVLEQCYGVLCFFA